MLTKLKHTFKQSFIYSLGNFAVKIVGLILLPLYTSYLSPEQYGILSLIETTSLFIVVVFSANISNAMMRWWADTKDNKKKKSYIFTGFVFLVFSIILMNVLLQPFSKMFAGWLLDDEKFYIYFNILFVSIAFDILNKYIVGLARILEKSVLFVIVNSVKLFVILSLNVYFIVVLKMGVKGIILAQLIGHIMGFLMFTPLLIKNIIIKIDFKALKEMLVYAIPLAFTALSMVLFSMGDRYVLKFLMGKEEVGIYGLAYKIAGFLNFFVLQSFQMGFLPVAYKMYKEENSARFFSKITTYLTIVLTFGALGLALFAPEFLIVFAPTDMEYWAAAPYVGLIGFVVILNGIRYMLGINFHLAKKTIIIPFIVISFALLNILLNFITIPIFNIYGVIISSIISSILMNIAYFVFGRKYYPVKYEIIKIIIIILIGIGLYLLTYLFKEQEFWLNIGLKSIIIFVFPIIILFGGFLEPIEKERVSQIWVKWKNPSKWKTNLKKMAEKKDNKK